MDGISQFRNTPGEDGFSPSQVVFGRSLRTVLPTLTEALGTNEFVEQAWKPKEILHSKIYAKFNQISRNLKVLIPGTAIWVQNYYTKRLDDKATIIAKIRKRTYKVVFEDGKHRIVIEEKS